MNPRLDLQHALACLQSLERLAPVDALTLSRDAGVAYSECRDILDRFEAAGIVSSADDAMRLVRPLSELTPLEVIQAVWSPAPAPKFRVLYAGHGRQVVAMKEAVAWAQKLGAYPSDGPVAA